MSNPDRLRCPNCRTRRTDPHAMAEHVRNCSRETCNCEGVPFERGLGTHRKGTRGCQHHPFAGLDRAARHGATPDELAQIEQRIKAELPDPSIPF